MGLTSAMLVGFTGIKSNQSMIDTVGDNVANVNTTAFKNQRALFETIFYRTLDPGSGPAGEVGGVNPQQVGYGSRLASLQRDFEQGSIQTTGVKSDVAIDGAGFLILQDANGDQVYTRDGSLALDENNALVAANGFYVQGFAADENGDIAEGVLSKLTVPLGTESEAVATTTAVMQGNLDASATPATVAAVVRSAPLVTATGAATTATQLTALVDGDGAALFNAGDVIAVRNAQKGGINLPQREFIVGTDGATVGDFATFLQSMTGIDTTATGGGVTPGVTVDTDGSLVVTSNVGEPNAISLDASNIRNDTTGRLPFTFTSTPAVGEGVTTGSVAVYDSLGNQVHVRLRTVLESRNESGSVWRFWAESTDDSDLSPLLGTGTLSFDQNGQLVGATGTDISVDQTAAGSATPLQFALDMSGVTSLNFGDDSSSLVMAEQDGRPGGTLIDYEIDADGKIIGTFSSSQTRVFGQLALSTFRNPEGLTALSENTYTLGANSGEAMIGAPRIQGAGSIRSRSLELSNVDLSREFVNLITASTGFSAASRVVRSADDMLQELLLLAR